MQLLYHYCSTETFLSIVRNRTVRLSSLTLSNDSREGGVILDVLLQLARESDLDASALSRLESHLRWAYELFDGLGFCLSEKGDLLSQWRGYADDGRGVCIGFNSAYFEKLGSALREREQRNFKLQKLIYDPDAQRAVAAEHFELIKDLLNKGAFKSQLGSLLIPTTDEDRAQIKQATEAGMFAVLSVMLRMFEIKSPAFAEEQEWRLVSFSTKKDPEAVLFRACDDKIVPYFEVNLEELEIEPIGAVVLGPKHQSPIHVVERVLTASGFNEIEITNSSATYR